MIRFFAGVVATLVVVAVAAFAAVEFGLLPAGADVHPGKLERWAANRSLDAAIAREAPPPPYPFGPPTDATFVAGAKLYMANCAVCLGSGAAPETMIASGQYVRPPQFAKHGVDDDPAGETYWKIEHGIRFTGMPSYAGALTEQQIWQITYFLGVPSDKLPAPAAAIWNTKPN